MAKSESSGARLRRGNRALALAATLGLLIALPRAVPAATPGNAPQDLPKVALQEFRGLCSDLATARERLAAGRLDESAFADTLLSLFAQADSLAQWLSMRAHGNPNWIPLQQGTRYLIASLRDNWVGIAAKNGMSFAEADTALKAALAWRSDVVAAEAVSP